MMISSMVVSSWSFDQSLAVSWLSSEVIGAVLGAIVAAALTFLITRGSAKTAIVQRNTMLQQQMGNLQATYDETKNQYDKTKDQLEATKGEMAQLRELAQRYHSVRTKLEQSQMVFHYEQPVLLLGRREVGKTSLMMQWHAPWDNRKLDPTRTHKESSVPVYDFVLPDKKPHFADPSIKTAAHVHLKLLVHDFPGEPDAQLSIAEIARMETQRLQQETEKNLGVVLICMFDAEEAAIGIKDETRRYYNGELFSNLRTRVSLYEIQIQRLIVVFNKFDLLRNRLPGEPAEDLLKLCVDTHYKIVEPFRHICNPERVCETVTVLDRDDLVMSQGSLVVLGEAARGLVGAMAGNSEAERWMGDNRATRRMAAKYPTAV